MARLPPLSEQPSLQRKNLMLSQEINNYMDGLIDRADLMMKGKSGPVVLDEDGLINLAKILDRWCEEAMALEGAVIAPAQRIHPEDISTGNVIQLRRASR